MIYFSQYLKGVQIWHCSNLFNWFIESLKYIRITILQINVLKNRFKNILVALDGSISSTRGMNEAISLARQCKGSITGIYVLPAFPGEPTISLSYRQYLVRVSEKFMLHAKTASRKTWNRVRRKDRNIKRHCECNFSLCKIGHVRYHSDWS